MLACLCVGGRIGFSVHVHVFICKLGWVFVCVFLCVGKLARLCLYVCACVYMCLGAWVGVDVCMCELFMRLKLLGLSKQSFLHPFKNIIVAQARWLPSKPPACLAYRRFWVLKSLHLKIGLCQEQSGCVSSILVGLRDQEVQSPLTPVLIEQIYKTCFGTINTVFVSKFN